MGGVGGMAPSVSTFPMILFVVCWRLYGINFVIGCTFSLALMVYGCLWRSCPVRFLPSLMMCAMFDVCRRLCGITLDGGC
jgi:hypothetical protein